MYVSGMGPFEEAQHILEVLQRNTSTMSVKRVSEDEAIIQIEQKTRKDANTVLTELAYRGYKIVSPLKEIAGGWTAGIRKERIRANDKTDKLDGFEPGDN